MVISRILIELSLSEFARFSLIFVRCTPRKKHVRPPRFRQTFHPVERIKSKTTSLKSCRSSSSLSIDLSMEVNGWILFELCPSAGGAFFIDSSPFRISFLCRTYVGIVRNCSMAIFCSQWPYSPPGSKKKKKEKKHKEVGFGVESGNHDQHGPWLPYHQASKESLEWK